MRVGRYPSMRDGGASWYGVIADTNAPEEDHWWAIMAGEVPIPDHIPREQATMLVKPDNWNFYVQPSAMVEEKNDKGDIAGDKMNPKAENKNNILKTKKKFLALGVAIPPYSGTIKINPSDKAKSSEIFFTSLSQNFRFSFFSDVHKGILSSKTSIS